MAYFDPDHLSWPFILAPSIIIAAVLKLDNRYFGPYFAIVDIVFNDFGSGYKWNDREILLSFTRRLAYIIVSGVILHFSHYRLSDIAAVFLIAGFLLIWPAFGHPLPIYARKSDWQVLFVWALYMVTIVAFGMFGATFLSLIQEITGQSPAKFIREALLGSLFWAALGLISTAFRVPLQRSLWQRKRSRPSGGPKNLQNG
jgi:hypothetical protein